MEMKLLKSFGYAGSIWLVAYCKDKDKILVREMGSTGVLYPAYVKHDASRYYKGLLPEESFNTNKFRYA
jgi:hypothetical protein